MEIFLDCLPCMLRQVLESTRMISASEELQQKVIDECIEILSNYKSYKTAPELCRQMHRIVNKMTGVADPYRHIKETNISTALRLYPHLKEFWSQKDNSLDMALKISATGNVLDSAINLGLDIEDCIDDELNKAFAQCDIEQLQQKLKTAKTLLVLGDNAGETVFDCILLEKLSDLDISYGVRSQPIINDATSEDAYASGIGSYAKVLSTGCDAPGVILEECSTDFIELFNDADIVISKGQGNYEALSNSSRDIFFLLKAKCSVLSDLLTVNINDYIFKYAPSK